MWFKDAALFVFRPDKLLASNIKKHKPHLTPHRVLRIKRSHTICHFCYLISILVNEGISNGHFHEYAHLAHLVSVAFLIVLGAVLVLAHVEVDE